MIGDKLNLSNVRLTRCAFIPAPEPGAAALGATACLSLALAAFRRRKSS